MIAATVVSAAAAKAAAAARNPKARRQGRSRSMRMAPIAASTGKAAMPTVTLADATTLGRAEADAPERSRCRDTASYSDLAGLPPGRVAGGRARALPARADAAPGAGRALPPQWRWHHGRACDLRGAPRRSAAAGGGKARHLRCRLRGDRAHGLSPAQRAPGLWAMLHENEPLAWLERLDATRPIAIYRVRQQPERAVAGPR